MIVTAVNWDGTVVRLDVSEQTELGLFKVLVVADFGVQLSDVVFEYNAKMMTDDTLTLAAYGITEDSIVVLHLRAIVEPPVTGVPRGNSVDSASLVQGVPADHFTDFAKLRQMMVLDPEEYAVIKRAHPELANAIERNDSAEANRILSELALAHDQRVDDESEEMFEIEDPLDPTRQNVIAEEIKIENINANMEVAVEHHPEVFGNVTMLFVDIKINNIPIKAFVDCGAQATIMSADCANRCNIMRLADSRFVETVRGVGTGKIIGRIHSMPFSISGVFFDTSFRILENQAMDVLIGLDMLRRHQCCIDLKNNVLRIGTTGTVTPFLLENEVPECARLNRNVEGSVSGESMQNEEQTFDEKVADIVAMGYDRDMAIGELSAYNGDKTLAIEALIMKSQEPGPSRRN